MRNRGPDSQDYRQFQLGDVSLVFLHARLSIIDLDSRANQPMTRDSCAVVFNGEIYNYCELRKSLTPTMEFLTESDTEVLLCAYLKYGEDCLRHFEGMWAFALYDARLGKLFLSRDRFGEKPLLYWETSHGIYFASEINIIRSLAGSLPTVNIKHLQRLLVNGYKSLYKTRDTFFNDVKELPAASFVSIDASLNISEQRYWHPHYQTTPMTLADAVAGTRERLISALSLRLRSDVPVAFCLSGGVDSSGLASIAAKELGYEVAAFSIIDHDPRYDESENIKTTVADLNCKSTQITLSFDGMLDRMRRLISYRGAPVYTISYLIHSMLSEQIAAQGYRVVLSGTGADELFTGYFDHFNFALSEMRQHREYSKQLSAWREHIEPIVRNPFLKNPEMFISSPNFRDHIYLDRNLYSDLLCEPFDEKFTETTYVPSPLRNRMLNELFHESVPAILHEDDLNSMQCSIENRSPFLDSNLFEFAYSIPTEFLIHDGYGKFILREALNGILNDQNRLDRHKRGFNASIASILDLHDQSTIEFLLSDSILFELVEHHSFKDFLMQLQALDQIDNSHSKFLFSFLSTKCFIEEYGI